MIALYASWDEHIFDKFEHKFANPLGRSARTWLNIRVIKCALALESGQKSCLNRVMVSKISILLNHVISVIMPSCGFRF